MHCVTESLFSITNLYTRLVVSDVFVPNQQFKSVFPLRTFRTYCKNHRLLWKDILGLPLNIQRLANHFQKMRGA